jgi:hypothetical protein
MIKMYLEKEKTSYEVTEMFDVSKKTFLSD